MRNYYKILEISDFSGSNKIHSAYRRLAKLYHPDVNPHYKLAAEMFKLVSEAYEVLSDPQKKMSYDSLLRQKNEEAKSHRPETAGDAAYASAENKKSGHSNNARWDVDDWFFEILRRSGNTGDSHDNAAKNRIPLFLRIVYFLDICLLGYFIYAMSTLDLSIVPKGTLRYGGYRWITHPWPIHFKVLIHAQKLSIWFSVFALLAPWLQRTSIFCSIFNLFTKRGLDMWFYIIVIHLFMKAVSAFECIAPFFGMLLFDISNGMILCAFLWHLFMGACLLVWSLDRFYKEQI